VLFLASPAETSLSLIRHRVAEDTNSRLCYIARGLYCNSVLASSPKTITDELQRVLNAAARLISGTGKYNRGLSRLLYWLDIPQRVQYKLAVTVHRYLRSQAPTYLADHCIPISEVAGRQHLRSARRQQLNVPRVHRVTGCLHVPIVGPTGRSDPGYVRLSVTPVGQTGWTDCSRTALICQSHQCGLLADSNTAYAAA